MENLENLENLLIFVEVREKKWIFFFGKWQKSWKSHGIYSLVPRIFSNRGGKFKGNYSNLRQVKLPDHGYDMRDCFVSSLLHYV